MKLQTIFTFLTLIVFLLFSCTSETGTNASVEKEKTSENEISKPKSLVQYLDYGDLELEYKIEGEGDPIIIPGSTIFHPRTFSNELRENFQLIFLNMRWYTPDYAPQNWDVVNLDMMVDDIEKLRKHLKLGRITVMGHSFHGLVALAYARKYPSNVNKVVGISTPGQKGNQAGQLENAYWAENASPERQQKYKENWEKNGPAINGMSEHQRAIATYKNNSPIYYYDYNFDSEPLWQGVQVNVYVMAHLLSNVLGAFRTSNLPEVSSPVFLALGKYDFSAPPTLWDEEKQAIPFLEYHVFEESGHSPQLEQQVLFDEKVIGWLKK